MPRCRVCNHAESSFEFEAREMMYGTREAFIYFRCDSCKCVQIKEIPHDLPRHYPADYYSLDANFDAEFSDPEERSRRADRVTRLLSLPAALAEQVQHQDMKRPLMSIGRIGLQRNDSVLDVGCGSGRLLYQLHEAGWTNGIGVDPYIPKTRRYDNGLTIVKGGLDDIDGTFDLIMLHHVFEHLEDPTEALSMIERRLSTKGVCLLRLPIADSDAFLHYGKDWVQLDAPRHLHLHTCKSMQIAAENAGLIVFSTTYDSYELQFWGSEQYKRDIPLKSTASYLWGHGEPIFSEEEVKRWKKQSDALNKVGRGDQAAFYLRRKL